MGHAECARVLIEAGADPCDVWPATCAAAKSGDVTQLRLYLSIVPSQKIKQAANKEDGYKDSKKSPLHWAAEKGHAECARVLIEAGADPCDAWPAICAAAKSGDVTQLRLYLSMVPSAANKEDGNSKKSPLHWAAEKGHAECARILIEAGADVNKEDGRNKSPLHWAAEKGHAECARILIEAGAKAFKVTEADIALALQSKNKDSYTLNLMLSMADKRSQAINAADNDGRTAAYNAVTDQNIEYLDVLLKHGALYLSKHGALLTQREKLIRLAEFAIAAVVIAGAVTGYLLSGRLTRSCDTAFDGLLLQPYLFDFVTVFVFKAFQYAFEELLLPAADFLWFCACRSCGGDDTKEGSTGAKLSRQPSPSSIVNPVTGIAGRAADTRRVSLRVSFDKQYPDRERERERERDSIPDNPMTMMVTMTMRPSLGGGGAAAMDIEMATRQGQTVPAAPAPHPSTVMPASHFSLTGLLEWAFTKKAVMAWRKKKYMGVKKADKNYSGDGFWYQVPYLFLYVQTITALISICVAAAHVDRSLPAWQQYSNFFAVVVNSGAPTQVFSIGKMMIIDGRGKQFNNLPWFVSLFITTPLIVLLAPFLTHLLPAVVLYCWLVFIILVIMPYIANDLLDWGFECIRANENYKRYHLNFYGEVIGRFVFIFLSQSLFTYAALFYASDKSPHAYIDVIAQDWHLRSQSLCFINEATASSRGIVTLFSWF